jgi:hypothetical protein
MSAGAALVVVGLLGRFAFGGGVDAASPSPPPAVSTRAEPSPEPTGPTATSEVPEPSAEPSAEPSEEPAETAEEFFELFAQAIRTGDEAVLLDRLHPVVLDLYGRRQCRAAAASIPQDPSFEARVRDVTGPEPYEYAPDGESITVKDAFTVALTFSTDEGTSRQDGHLALVEGEMRWFTDCGDPLA